MNAPADAKAPPAHSRLAAALAVPVAPLAAAHLAYVFCHPRRAPRRRGPAEFGLDPEEVVIDGVDGPRLHGWLCRADTDRVVVLGHGIGLDKSRSLAHAKFLHQAGFTVLLFDFRNHGASSDDHSVTKYSARFMRDVTAAVTHLRAMPEFVNARLAVYGLSLSTYAMLYALGRPDSGIDAVVCDSGPTRDPDDTMRNFLRAGSLPLPRPFQTAPASVVLETSYRLLSPITMGTPASWPPDPADPPYGRTPMLFIAGGADAVVPPAELRQLAAPFPHAEVLEIPAAGHLRGLAVDPQRYSAAVLGFLDRALAAPGEAP